MRIQYSEPMRRPGPHASARTGCGRGKERNEHGAATIDTGIRACAVQEIAVRQVPTIARPWALAEMPWGTANSYATSQFPRSTNRVASRAGADVEAARRLRR